MAAILRQIDQDLTIEDIILGNPAYNEVLVKVAATGLCHTDLHFMRAHLPVQTYAVVDDVFPPSVTNCDGWLITGLRHRAYKGLAWMRKLEDFLRDAHAAQTPIVRVCFGHQILAQAHGDKAEKSPLDWAVAPTNYASQAVTNAWHQYQVTVLPETSTRIAISQFCQNASLCISRSRVELSSTSRVHQCLHQTFVEHAPGSVTPKHMQEGRPRLRKLSAVRTYC